MKVFIGLCRSFYSGVGSWSVIIVLERFVRFWGLLIALFVDRLRKVKSKQ